MLNYEINLKGGCVYSCRVIEDYDVWKAIGATFDSYDIMDMKVDFYNMFKLSVLVLKEYYHETYIESITFCFEHVNDLIDSLYYVAKDKGAITEKPAPAGLFPRKWVHKRRSADNVLYWLCKSYEPYEMRDNLWDMFLSGFVTKAPRLSKKGRKRMISLFENITDLMTAAYVLANHPSLTIVKPTKKENNETEA